MNNNRPLTIYTASSRKATILQAAPTDVYSLFTQLGNSQALPVPHAEYIKLPKAQQDDLKDNGAYIAGTLKDGRRKAGSVVTRCAAVLDADNIRPGEHDNVLRAVLSLGCSVAIHSTAKDSTATPRLRIVFPFSKDIPAEMYGPVVRVLCRLIQPEKTWFDPTCAEAGRIMYWPSHCIDVVPVFIMEEGRGLLDPEGLLAQQLPSWRDMSTWPTFPREQTPTKLGAKQEDPESKKGVVGAFCRVYDIYRAMDELLPGIYDPVDGVPNRYTFTGGSTTGGAVVYDNGKFLYSHHATDPCGGRLVNAFDLVRIHKYGDLDDEAAEGARGNRLPSYISMIEFARADPATAAELARMKAEELEADFGHLANEDAGAELAKCEGRVLSVGVVRNALGAFGIEARNNLIAGKVEISGLPATYSTENAANTLPVFLLDRLRSAGIKAVNKTAIMDYLANICDENRYNPVAGMLAGAAWDGTDRVQELLNIMGIQLGSLSATLVWKWLIQCVALANNSLEQQESAEGVLTLQGPQGVGKTLFFRRLALRNEWFVEGATLDLKDKDSIMRAVSGWITELGELDATLRRDQSSIKAFITSPTDRIRAPYARETTFRPRRTSFCATVNPGGFLRDDTGDRRFWVIPVPVIDLRTLLNLPEGWFVQLWAEVYAAWQTAPESFRMTSMEMQALDLSNQKYREPLPGEIELRERLNFNLPVDQWGEFSAAGVLFGMREKVDSRVMGRVLAKLEREEPRITSRKKDGYRLYRLPIPAVFSTIHSEVNETA